MSHWGTFNKERHEANARQASFWSNRFRYVSSITRIESLPSGCFTDLANQWRSCSRIITCNTTLHINRARPANEMIQKNVLAATAADQLISCNFYQWTLNEALNSINYDRPLTQHHTMVWTTHLAAWLSG